MTKSDLLIRVDDRVRLLSTALAATGYPQMAQEQKRHHPHAHARATLKMLHENGLDSHPAVLVLQAMLDEERPLEDLYAAMLDMPWPGLQMNSTPDWMPSVWPEQLWEFYQQAQIHEWWQSAQSVWSAAVSQCVNVFQKMQIGSFLRPFLGEIVDEFYFMPNLVFPAHREISLRNQQRLIAIVPPPQAWGESPPWPYDEESMLIHAYRAALRSYTGILLREYLAQHRPPVEDASKKELPVSNAFKAIYPTWEQQFIELFITAAVAIYLEDHVAKIEAQSYMLMEKRTRDMTILPGTISVLRRYLQEYGKKYQTLADFLYVFPAQLRVAKRIVTL